MSLKFRLLQDLSTQVSEAGPTLSRKNPRPPTDAGSAHQVSSLAMWQGAPTWVRPPKPGSEDKRQPPSPSPRRPFACPGRGFALTLRCAPSALVEHFPCYPGLRSGGRAAPPQPWAGLFQACRRLAKVGTSKGFGVPPEPKATAAHWAVGRSPSTTAPSGSASPRGSGRPLHPWA